MKPFLIATLAALGVVTCACSSSSPAAQPAHTVTVTAHAAASRSVTPTPTPSPPTSPVAARCQTKNLSASAGAPQGYRSGLQMVIVFTNTGTAPCTLAGYPTVWQAGGTPATTIGEPARQDPATPRTVVTLPPERSREREAADRQLGGQSARDVQTGQSDLADGDPARPEGRAARLVWLDRLQGERQADDGDHGAAGQRRLIRAA